MVKVQRLFAKTNLKIQVCRTDPKELEGASFSFENIAFIMAKHADHAIPDTSEEGLDRFNTFSIYQVLPQLIELWGLNVKTEVESKKSLPN